ncbi:MAG: hypothetical protein ACREPR_13385 [Brasilonema sp.]
MEKLPDDEKELVFVKLGDRLSSAIGTPLIVNSMDICGKCVHITIIAMN